MCQMCLVPTISSEYQTTNRAFMQFNRPQPNPTKPQPNQGGVDVIVATPGRAAALLARGLMTLEATKAVVLDEVDVLCGEPVVCWLVG
jgi:superfamily II DNA/RNA helicase